MNGSPPSVLVLSGGLSAEREVSLQSGQRVVSALRDAGVGCHLLDVGADLVDRMTAERPDLVWPVLHGADGEDGALSQVLDLLEIPFVGSSAQACRLAWDKSIAASLVRSAGVSVPRAVTLSHAVLRDHGAAALLPRVLSALGDQLVVKPVAGGSSLGISMVASAEQLAPAMATALGRHDVCRVEQRVRGTEVAVGVVGDPAGARALVPVEISPDSGEYDYEARYTPGSTEFHCPARLPAAVLDRLQSDAVAVHLALGLGHLSRSDWIVDEHGVPWFLEVNTSPGLTDTSSVPVALASAGVSLPTWCAQLVGAARS